MTSRRKRYNFSMKNETLSQPLVIRLCNWVGEVVLMIPTLERLAAAGFELTLYGKPWARDLLASYPWQVMNRPKGIRASVSRLKEWRQAQTQNPQALLFTKSFSSALESRWAGIPASGYAYDGRSFLLANAFEFKHFDHAAETYWQLANYFLNDPLPLPRPIHWEPSLYHQLAAEKLLQQHGLLASNTVMLCPFSGADDKAGRKHWPQFGELAQRLSHEGQSLLICPGPGEEAKAEALYPKALSLPQIPLGVYGALMKSVGAVVANDTGPGHLAAAAGARVVSIYGPHSNFYWSPLGKSVSLFANPHHWPELDPIHASVRRFLDQP